MDEKIELGNYEKIFKFAEENSIVKLNFIYFGGDVLAKTRAFWNNLIILQQFPPCIRHWIHQIFKWYEFPPPIVLSISPGLALPVHSDLDNTLCISQNARWSVKPNGFMSRPLDFAVIERCHQDFKRHFLSFTSVLFFIHIKYVWDDVEISK